MHLFLVAMPLAPSSVLFAQRNAKPPVCLSSGARPPGVEAERTESAAGGVGESGVESREWAAMVWVHMGFISV